MSEKSVPAKTVELSPDPGAEGDPVVAPPAPPEPVEEVVTVSYPDWGPAPDPEALSQSDLEQARIFGQHNLGPSPYQPAVERLEEVLRSHGIGGTNRNSEGYYGDKTRDLVVTAYTELLGKPSSGVVGRDLLDEINRRYGVRVTA